MITTNNDLAIIDQKDLSCFLTIAYMEGGTF